MVSLIIAVFQGLPQHQTFDRFTGRGRLDSHAKLAIPRCVGPILSVLVSSASGTVSTPADARHARVKLPKLRRGIRARSWAKAIVDASIPRRDPLRKAPIADRARKAVGRHNT